MKGEGESFELNGQRITISFTRRYWRKFGHPLSPLWWGPSLRRFTKALAYRKVLWP